MAGRSPFGVIPVRLTPLAISDVGSIWRYFAAQGGVEVADRVLERLETEFARIASMPARGHRRPDLTSHPVLFVRVYKFLIAYQTSAAEVMILAVLHGHRDLARELGQRTG